MLRHGPAVPHSSICVERLSVGHREKGRSMRTAPLARGRSTRLAALTAIAKLLLLVPAGAAQTPVSEDQASGEPHPAHIHAGTCDDLGEVVLPLTDVAPVSGETVGSASAYPVESGLSIVDMPLQEIIDGGHAINV